MIDGRLYLFGGLGHGAEGQVQIYNPVTDSWTLGAPMPFKAGSSASALINGRVYVAGGIVSGTTTSAVAEYNPLTNTWRSVASMPQGRNYAAAGTDGARMIVFGGRTGGPEVSNGFATVQIYDPATNSWRSSATDPTLAPLPAGRGGFSRAAYLEGRFYVLGGETQSSSAAAYNNVYDRVDIYTLATNTWRSGVAMPTGRHGIYPLAVGGRLYVAGGGTFAGPSNATTMEVYNPPWFVPGASGPLSINVGGPAVTTGGVHWIADTGFGGGKAFASSIGAIEGTTDDVLYRTERSATSWGGSFSYAIPVAQPGPYLVRLHFAEIYWGAPGGGVGGAGQRVFDVNLEGGPVELAEYDINADAGPATAVIKEYVVNVADGVLNINFSASVDQPKISALEIRPLPQSTGPPLAQVVPQVTDLELINADLNQPLDPAWTLRDGVRLDLAQLPTRNLNIRAAVDQGVAGSVQFILDGQVLRVDNQPPYALAGSAGSNYWSWTPAPGPHTLTARPFSGTYASGAVGSDMTISFIVLDSSFGQKKSGIVVDK